MILYIIMIFQDILENILTVYFIIAFGFFIAKKMKMDDDSFLFLRNICYKFLFPLLLGTIFYKYQLNDIITPSFIKFLIFISIAIFSCVFIYCVHKKNIDLNRVFVVAFSSSFTNSGFLGLSVVYLTFPKEYIVPAAVITYIFYVVSILLKEILFFLQEQRINLELVIEFLRNLVKKFICDPIIIVPMIAFMFANDNSRIVSNLDNVLEMITNATYFLGLLLVGISLCNNLDNCHEKLNINDEEFVFIAFSTFIKLLVFPLFVMVMCLFVNLSEMMKFTLILQSAMPTGIIIISQFNKNNECTKLINTIGFVSTILSSVTVIVILLLANFVIR